MNEIIKFYSGEENGVVRETKLDESIFDRQYRKAGRLLDNIAHHYSSQSSNIIAFCGDRGDGKTSAMLSFVESLDDNVYNVLNPISPSHFDEEHNILELVLGQMYQAVEEDISNSYESLMDCFAAVERCCAVLKPGAESLYDRIAEIHELSASMNLHFLIQRLFLKYLEVKKKQGGKVVIVIDDMDYNWYGAYTMIKMIEKYLHNEHCVLVVSVRIEQLAELVRVGFERELKGNVSAIDLKKIAQKYINKVIPIFNRIEMPKVRDIVDKKLLIFEDRRAETEGKKPLENFNSVKEGVLKLIFLKTRYLFYNSKGSVSLIVPNDLRSLRQLLGLLMGMKDFQKDSSDLNVKDENRENKRLFKYYFFYTWTQQLDEDDRLFADKLVDNNDTYSINKLVLNYMQRYLDEKQKGDYTNILKTSNYGYNITVGDVFDMMDMIERNALDVKSRMMSFYIRSFYSIRLYEYYDEATEDKIYMKTLHPVAKEEKSSGMPEIYKSDPWFINTNSLQRFVNGSYFTYHSGKVIEYVVDRGNEKFDLYPLDAFCMDGSAVRDFFTIVNNMSDEDENFKKAYQFAEYLMLGILTSVSRREDDVRNLEKDLATPLYLKPFIGDEGCFVFDIMAPFSNMINIRYCYERFGNLLEKRYDYAAAHDWTILGRMKQRIPPLTGNHPESKVASDAIIRNAEVLNSVRERVLSHHILIKDKTKCLSSFAEVYSSLIDSDMKTYPQTREQEDIYTIQFEFLRVLSEVLKEINCACFNEVLVKYIDVIIEGDTSGLEI